jgi:hypothetical protein
MGANAKANAQSPQAKNRPVIPLPIGLMDVRLRIPVIPA